jgi:hypothetical protein
MNNLTPRVGLGDAKVSLLREARVAREPTNLWKKTLSNLQDHQLTRILSAGINNKNLLRLVGHLSD